MTTTDPRAWLAELTDHLTDMADSLDDHVTHEDVYRLLMEALDLSRQRDAALTAVLDVERRTSDAGSCTTYSDGYMDGWNHARSAFRRAITEKLGDDRAAQSERR